MKSSEFLASVLFVLLSIAGFDQFLASPQPLQQQNENLLRQLQRVHGLSDEQIRKIRDIFVRSGYIGQGNPAITQHPMTPEESQAKVMGMGVNYENPKFDEICKDKYMAPLFDPSKEKAEDAKTCIDQFEFPDIPFAYPVVWVRAREAAEICWTVGKRLCDAHEWEGACSGTLEPPDYRFDLAKDVSSEEGFRRMRAAHNQKYSPTKSWSYGTYPSGSFPSCRSSLDVYDLNGNAAEHMNLPLNEHQMSSLGSTELGYTEMKGSWFVFDTYRAHDDWCRWRAPFWHGSRVMDKSSHANYHLGFRCCKSLDDRSAAGK